MGYIKVDKGRKINIHETDKENELEEREWIGDLYLVGK